MRKACTSKQHELFDEIFGDRLIFDVGDYLYCIKDVIMKESGEEEFTQDKVYLSEKKGCLTNNSGNENHRMGEGRWCSIHFRLATQEEVIKASYPPEGTPHLVKENIKDGWNFRYADGNGGFYYPDNSDSRKWTYIIDLTKEAIPSWK